MSTITPHIDVQAWNIRETYFDAGTAALHETLFTVGNGQIGVRGAQEEGAVWAGTLQNDVFLNGFFETEPIVYPESAYGFASSNQFIVRIPNATGFTVEVDGEKFTPSVDNVSDYQRTLDFHTGILARSLVWRSVSGKQIRVTSERLVSFQYPAIVALRYSITPLNFSGTVTIYSTLDNRTRSLDNANDPRVGASLMGQLKYVSHHIHEPCTVFMHETHESHLTLATGVAHSQKAFGFELNMHGAQNQFVVDVVQNQSTSLDKFVSYLSSQNLAVDQLQTQSQVALREVLDLGFDALAASQKKYLDDFWAVADIEIGGDDALQQGIRFAAFHLLQSTGHDGKTNIAAKGVTGAGYDGHYFWDTEIYVLPFFIHTSPEIARQLIMYRVNTLDAARARAREMAHDKGALYPWRTITGSECSSYFPAGTAQYHINADIAYAAALYVRVSGDKSVLTDGAAEMVFETARIWQGLGEFGEDGLFRMFSVTGPDEYTAIVNNNLFTNAMARHHLQFALETAQWLENNQPAVWAQVSQKIALDGEELSLWQRMADNMYLPYDEQKGIHPQDDAFLSKPVWDFEHTPADKYPLLLNYHPLVIYRHQVCKQADVVLALMLLNSAFNRDDKKRDYDYYETITTHDSSLSTCIFSIMASEVGYFDKAYDYFMQTARLDLDNLHHNTHHGVHAAALAGTWMSVVYGFAGMRSHDGLLHFAPHLPVKWTHYQFRVRAHGCLLQARVDKEGVVYQLLAGNSLQITHKNSVLVIGDEPKFVPHSL